VRRIGITVLAVALLGVAVPAAGLSKKQKKPIKTAASVSIGSLVVSDADPQSVFFRFSGVVSSKAACRSGRSVTVAVSTDGGPAVPGKGGKRFACKGAVSPPLTLTP
jgi:hypothetical protein